VALLVGASRIKVDERPQEEEPAYKADYSSLSVPQLEQIKSWLQEAEDGLAP
jgi:hypothetical protein